MGSTKVFKICSILGQWLVLEFVHMLQRIALFGDVLPPKEYKVVPQVARAEDESTGYVLPNKSVLEIAKQMPVTPSKLQLLVKSKHLYVEHNLDSVVNIIRHSIQNAAAFEVVAQQLKEGNSTTASDAVPVTYGIEDPLL